MQKIIKMLTLVGVCALLGLVAGCEQKQDPIPPAATTAPVEPAAPAAPVEPAAPAVDHKAEAAKEITADNAEAMADQLDKELEAELAE